MACAAGPDIKEDGLVLALDAANTKSILSAVEVLVVAGGGGGGGSTAGGGGGGGVIYNRNFAVTPGSAITATVGAGGQGTVRSNQGAPTNTSGGNSVFGALTAIGGGKGYSGSDTFTPGSSAVGGSGGGGGYFSGGLNPKGSGTSSAGTAGQGFAGGDGAAIGEWGGGGGGGAGGAGGAQVANNSLRTGGPGLGFNISGTLQYYGGGGGGGCYLNGFSLGGIGGGGNGGDGQTYTPTAGGTNTGGGGGAGGYYQFGPGGGAGGSGIVIVRYPGSQRASGGTVTFVAGHTIHTFTTSGTFTPNFGDMTGNGNNGTLVNGVGYNSGNGGSLVFDGVNDVVNSTTSIIDRANGQEITVSCWIKPSRTSGQYSVFCTNRSNNAAIYNWIFYQHTTDGAIAFHGAAQNKSSYVPTINVWINVTNTVTASGVSTLYVNGVSTYTATGYTYGNGTPSRLGIGADPGGQEPFQGNISQVSIYNRALSAAEVQQNFIATRSRFGI